MTYFEASDWADVITNQLDCFFSDLVSRIIFKILGFHCDKSNRDLAFYFISYSNNYGFGYLGMFHKNLLHLSCWQSMASSVNNIILSRHDMKISILVIESRISCIVVALYCCEIFLHIEIVVVEDSEHKGWRQGLLYIDCSCFIGLALCSSCAIHYFYVVSG